MSGRRNDRNPSYVADGTLPFAGRDRWAAGGAEPAVLELLSDPIVIALMRVDGVRVTDVLAMASRISLALVTPAEVQPLEVANGFWET